jgi:hypothetical protein
MAKASFTKDQSAPALSRPANAPDALRADHSIRIDRPDAERLEGKPQKRRTANQRQKRSAKFSSLLDRRIKTRTNPGFSAAGFAGDRRQQAVVKLHCHNHVGGGGGGMASHVAYVAHEGAARGEDRLAPAERHADYLTRDGERGRDLFYSADQERIDGRSLSAEWVTADKRHFRIVPSAEEGGALRDLPSYTREVMARAEGLVSKPLAWIAIDH